MTTSLLQGKRFYCREWAFSKISHCVDSRPSSKTCGALIMGGPGCGKTALCCEVTWPTAKHGKQVSLSKRVLAAYYCQAHDIETLSITNFIHCLVEQIGKSDLIVGYSEQLLQPPVQAVLDPVECERDPDEAFKKGVLLPLLSINPPSHNLFLLVDSIDESYLQEVAERTSGSKTIAELLANHHQLFPPWLMLICSARKQSKSVTRMFTGFRKISLDDLRKSHVVRDVQQYILCRLDQEEQLRQHLSRETAEMLNQLHIKSNGCFLYLEKVLDGVAENFIMLREVKEIPGTLNGLYLWLCQRLFVKKQFSKILPILNVILAARRPLTDTELYSCAFTKDTTLTFEEFQIRMDLVKKILNEGKDGTKMLFHHSFAEWLLDVKHCTQKFLCTAAEGHGMLAMSFTMQAHDLTSNEVQDLALHLSKSGLKPPILPYHLTLWMLQSGANIEESLKGGLPKDQSILKLLHQAGANMPTPDEMESAEMKLRYVPEEGEEEAIKNLLKNGTEINQPDMSGRTLLANASYQGNLQVVTMLLAQKPELEAIDKNGQTALNLAARQGHTEVVSTLLEAGSFHNHTDTDGWTPLRSAAWGGHTEVVTFLLEAGAEVDQSDSDQRTALRAAAWGGHDDIVMKLLEHGAEVNKIDNEGRTALIAAAYMGHTDIVMHLLDNGADINQEDSDGRTALSVASMCVPASDGHSSVVSLLLDRGAQVDHKDKDGMTPLLVAAYEGHHEVCELLLEGDADVDEADNTGRSPLQAAASSGHATIVTLLLFWGSAVDAIDSDGRTVLCLAAQQGNVDIVRQLLDRGLDEMHRDNAGWTPMHMAAFEGHKEVIDALIESGARISEIDNDGRIPLILAAQEGHTACVAALIDAGSPLEAKAHDGKTALRIAALEGHKETVHYLFCQGGDIDYMDADGRSTLYVLALENHTRMAAALLQNGCDVESHDLEGRTALHVAAWQGHYEMCEVLLSKEANVMSVDNDKRTALQSAAWQGHVDIVKLLLKREANVNHTCNQGATALCIAAQEGHTEVVKVLLSFNADPLHADQYGRTATRVAMKGGHSQVVKLIEDYQFGAPIMNGHNGQSKQNGQLSSPNPTTNLPPAYSNSNPIYANGQMFHSPSDSPGSTYDRRKSCLSNNSSSNLNSNTSSTNQSSSSMQGCLDLNSPAGMSFTQQLQQCSGSKNRNRPISRVLSPVSEPPNSPAPHSSNGSSQNEIQRQITPDPKEILSSPITKISPRLDHASTKPSSNSKAAKKDNTITEEPIWQRHPEHNQSNTGKLQMHRQSSLNEVDMPPGVVMGQSSLNFKSPENRRKRNGICTNPNYKTQVSMNGYFNKLSNLPDTIDNYPVVGNGNGSMPQKSNKPATRPSGLNIKKETPL